MRVWAKRMWGAAAALALSTGIGFAADIEAGQGNVVVPVGTTPLGVADVELTGDADNLKVGQTPADGTTPVSTATAITFGAVDTTVNSVALTTAAGKTVGNGTTTLTVDVGQSLDVATTLNLYRDAANSLNLAVEGGDLTVGGKATLAATAVDAAGSLTAGSLAHQAGAFENDGAVETVGQAAFAGAAFDNAGTVTVGNGAAFTGPLADNTGLITVTAGNLVATNVDFYNAGTVTVTAGAFTSQTAAGGAAYLYNDVGGAVNAGTVNLVNTQTFNEGTIGSADGLSVVNVTGGTLDNDGGTIRGTVTLSKTTVAAAGAIVGDVTLGDGAAGNKIDLKADGLAVNGNATIANGAELQFAPETSLKADSITVAAGAAKPVANLTLTTADRNDLIFMKKADLTTNLLEATSGTIANAANLEVRLNNTTNYNSFSTAMISFFRTNAADGKSVSLTANVKDAAAVGQTANASRFGAGLDNYRNAVANGTAAYDKSVGDFVTRLYNERGLGTVSQSLQLASGEDFVNAATFGALRAADRQRQSIANRMEQRLTGARYPDTASVATTTGYARVPAPEYLPNRIWASGFYDWQNQKSRGGVNGFDFDNGGFTLGYDRAFGCVLLGGAFGYSYGDFDARGASDAKTEVELFYFSGYGALRLDDFFLDGNLAFGHANNWSKQHLPYQNGKNETSFDTDVWAASVRAGYNFRFGGFRVTPSAGLNLSYADADGFKESGPLARRFSDLDQTSLEMPVGAKFGYVFRAGDVSITPEAGAYWVHEWADTGSGTTARLVNAGSAGWRVNSLQTARDQFMGTAGVKARLGANVEFSAGWEGRFASGRQDHNVNAAIGFKF